MVDRHIHSEQVKEHQEEKLYGASREFQQYVLEALDASDHENLHKLILNRHAADVADLIRILRSDDRQRFLTAARFFLKAEVLTRLEDYVREEVLEILGSKAIASAIADLNTDDALELIEDLNDDQLNKILHAMPEQERAILEEILAYPSDSAGRMMQRETICVPPFWTVKETIQFIRDTEDSDTNYYDIYVVDSKQHPIGEIPLSALLRNPLDKPVSEIMLTNVRSIPVQTDQEDVALTFQHYALVSAPVIDQNGRMVGMITVDNVVHVIRQEAEEDIMRLANIGESDFYAPVGITAYWRMRWLIVTLLTSLLTSIVIAQFQDSIQKITALAFLMPIGAAMGGSAGMQVVTIVVRALATRALNEDNKWRTVGKEISVSLIIGSFFAISAGLAVALWMNDYDIAIVLALGIIFNMLWSAFAGTMIPITLNYFKLDPAVSAGPILMTTTDILGFAVFLGLATLLLL